MESTIPETTSYLYLGLGAILVIAGLYVGSIVARYVRYQEELDKIVLRPESGSSANLRAAKGKAQGQADGEM
jgi:hypothetical protein